MGYQEVAQNTQEYILERKKIAKDFKKQTKLLGLINEFSKVRDISLTQKNLWYFIQNAHTQKHNPLKTQH